MQRRSAPDGVSPDLPVSRETLSRLEIYVGELRRWQRAVNLVGPATLETIWDRHVRDSLQLASLAGGGTWVDLGSGAGIPGLVLAACPSAPVVHLVESDARKCSFLRHVAHMMSVEVTVWQERIETALPRLAPNVNVVTARGLSPLPLLLAYAAPALERGAVGLFPKGKQYEAELTAARESWRFAVDLIPSETDPAGRILRITDFLGPQRSQAGDKPD